VKRSGRYAVSGLVEGQFEPGSQGRVLRNLIGIKRKREMDRAEGKELVRTFESLISGYDESHKFGVTDLCNMHKEWLGSIYGWAGKYRQVNLAKGDFTFAAAHLIPELMDDFEHQCLAGLHALPNRCQKRDNPCPREGARGVVAHPSFSGGQRACGAHIGVTHGASGKIASPGFRHVEGKEKTEIFYCGAVWPQSELRANGEDFRRGD